MPRRLELAFEGLLWNSRLVALVAVVASMVVALIMFWVATVDTFHLVHDVLGYARVADDVRKSVHASIITHVAEVVDGYLFGAIMIIFSLGLYELFVSRIDAAERSPVARRLLLIHSLDDLKERLAKVIFLILIVRYFEYALQSPISNQLDLLYLAVGIALIAVSLYLTAHKPESHPSPDEAEPASP